MRTEAEVFADLRDLCREPGYVHALAFICFRDNMISFKREVKAKDMRHMFSSGRLLRTEISVLAGLLVQGKIDYALPSPMLFQSYITQSDEIFKEFHDVMGAAMMQGLLEGRGVDERGEAFGRGAFLREPFFYGGEAAYSFQYRDFAPQKYWRDNDWLSQSKGFEIAEARDAAEAIANLQNKKLHSTQMEMQKSSPDTWTILPGYMLTAEEVAQESGLSADKARRVLEAFTHSEHNEKFQSVGDFNAICASPLIRVDGERYLLLQYYNLVEALYESPFYWMIQDNAYRSKASENRGKFTETFATDRLAKVFGSTSVHQNIDLVAKKGSKLGEIDALVVFGDRLIVLQAKSKRLTLGAKKGDDEKIRADFQKAIQDSYDQALSCAKHLLTGDCKVLTAGGDEVQLEWMPKEIFLLCVVADNYPALSFQSRQFLKYEESAQIKPPLVIDVFFLDVLAEMLDSPLRFLSYVKRRVEYNERIHATHELTVLSYHLKTNLWLDDDHGVVSLGDDIAVDLDVAMSVRRDNLPGARTPTGILTHLSGTSFDRLIKKIEGKGDPGSIELGFFLLTLSENTSKSMSMGLDQITRMVRADGKAHDFSIGTVVSKEGLTVHCNPASEEKSARMLLTHCSGKKYAQRANKWFGLCVDLDAEPVHGVCLEFDWEQSDEMDKEASRYFRGAPIKDMATGFSNNRRRKIGRNDHCPCGSGLKYKRCCIGR
ncbi:hypothetical protein B0E51_06975 [Rhodanobacter sp. C05]|nr:hypothetical protein B0E51_06975 [Rhodanobacter sp. C05]